MINWLKRKLTKTVVVYSIPDYMLEPCYKDGFYTVKGWNTDHSLPLFELDVINGKAIICNINTLNSIYDLGQWSPVSIQSLDPDEPLTSELMYNLDV